MTTAIAIAFIFSLALLIFLLAAQWIIFTKAGRPGWAVLIPIYNMIVYFQVCKINPWFILLYLLAIIPIIGFFVLFGMSLWTSISLGNAFNKSGGFIVGLILLPIVFVPILAFGSSTYSFDNDYDNYNNNCTVSY